MPKRSPTPAQRPPPKVWPHYMTETALTLAFLVVAWGVWWRVAWGEYSWECSTSVQCITLVLLTLLVATPVLLILPPLVGWGIKEARTRKILGSWLAWLGTWVPLLMLLLVIY